MIGNRLLRVMMVIIVFSLVCSLPVVYGYWQYGERVDISNQKVFDIKYFPWIGEEVLPDDEEEGETSQYDGLQIILDALNNKTINGSSESKLNAYIEKRVQNFNKLEYGSVDVKEDIAEMVSDVTEMNPNFEFILSGIIVGSGKNKEVESFYLYMIDKPEFQDATDKWDNSGLSESNYERDPSIFNEYFYPVNRVKIEKDAYGQWTSTIAEVGYAGYGYYEGSNNGGGQKVWTFDPSSWQAGSKP